MALLVTLAAAAGLAAATPSGAAPSAVRVEIDGAALRLRDLAQIAGFAEAARSPVGGRTIAALPEGRGSIVIRRGDLAALVRRAAPAARIGASDPDATVTIVRRAREALGCVVAARPIAAEEAIAPDDVTAGACEAGGPRAPLRYRADRGVIATSHIAAGAPLGRLAAPAPPSVVRGVALTLVSRAGPVTISRGVTALQAGRPGQKLFVRDPDGAVFPVRLEVQEEERR